MTTDALVEAIFSAMDAFPIHRNDKLRAIARAGKIVEVYLGPYDLAGLDCTSLSKTNTGKPPDENVPF